MFFEFCKSSQPLKGVNYFSLIGSVVDVYEEEEIKLKKKSYEIWKNQKSGGKSTLDKPGSDQQFY